MRPCELNSPVLGEREWMAGYPTVSRVFGTIWRVADGHVGLGESYGTHINVSFGSYPGETSDDIVRTLKRLLTITWIVEDHIFGVLCPDREAHCGPYLSSARDWPEPTTPGSEGASSPACREMEEDLPQQLVSERGREMELI